jgi:hypothetical protein
LVILTGGKQEFSTSFRVISSDNPHKAAVIYTFDRFYSLMWTTHQRAVFIALKCLGFFSVLTMVFSFAKKREPLSRFSWSVAAPRQGGWDAE